MTGFLDKLQFLIKKVEKFCKVVRENFFLGNRNFDIQSLINLDMTGFASAYPKSNFESNFWISQTFGNSLKTANVRIYNIRLGLATIWR